MFLPVLLALTVVNQGSPLFFQKRTGKNGKPFYLIKLKTMSDKRNTDGQLLPDSARLHRFGRFLRKTSLDEIPQLINILKGDMSFIGPRPLLHEYMPLYSSFQRKRHLLKPGISGWAQVNGRNTVTWEEKFKLDVFYVENVSIALDTRILLLTVKKVVMSEGVNTNDGDMMPFFQGTKSL